MILIEGGVFRSSYSLTNQSYCYHRGPVVVYEPKQILVPPEVAKVIIYFLKALVIHNKKICDSKVTFAA